ncbi:uncharacterized protein LOC121857552 [Homarus americanus]|uniref:uncharacterized protein LOC121857552 n=1 Tax=Homarus americanus TaxID=6706 RepID=UPI001C4831DD|nr:uncharacterized protein LOC121857552 [Homarus americanus]
MAVLSLRENARIILTYQLIRIILIIGHLKGYLGESCLPLFPTDHHEVPEGLPTILQFEPSRTSLWKSYFEIVNENDLTLACLEITGCENNTILNSSSEPCENNTAWENTVYWPPFLRDNNNWFNFYSMFISAQDNVISLDINQRPDYDMFQEVRSPARGIRRVNMTHSGPKITFTEVRSQGQCLVMTHCKGSDWVFLSVGPLDEVDLVPITNNPIKIKVALSNCFPDYHIGLYNSTISQNNLKFPPNIQLRLKYTRMTRYHTLSASVGEHLTLFSSTVEHHGRDCSSNWFLLGVKDAEVITNCYGISNSLPVSSQLPSSARSIGPVMCVVVMMMVVVV